MTMKIKKDVCKRTFIISNMSTNFNSKNIANIYIDSDFTADGIIKINANYNYSYNDSNNFSHIYINFIIIIKNLKNLKNLN